MKQYHTDIIVNAPAAVVWQELNNFADYATWNPLVSQLEGDIREGGEIKARIIPLGQKLMKAKLLVYQTNKELTWEGKQIANFVLTAHHYYKLEALSPTQTHLLHGEIFTGIAAFFMPSFVLRKMKNVFVEHNERLKQRVESLVSY